MEKKNEDEGDKKTKTKKWKDKERKTFVFVVPKKERTDEVTTQTEANSLVTFLGGPKAVRLPFFNFRPPPPPLLSSIPRTNPGRHERQKEKGGIFA